MLFVNIVFGITAVLTLYQGFVWANKKGDSVAAPGSSVVPSKPIESVLAPDVKVDSKPINSAVIQQRVGVSEIAIANKVLTGTDLKINSLMPVVSTKQSIM